MAARISNKYAASFTSQSFGKLILFKGGGIEFGSLLDVLCLKWETKGGGEPLEGM